MRWFRGSEGPVSSGTGTDNEGMGHTGWPKPRSLAHAMDYCLVQSVFGRAMMALDWVPRALLWPQRRRQCGEADRPSRRHPAALSVEPQVRGTKAEARQAGLGAAREARWIELGVQLDWRGWWDRGKAKDKLLDSGLGGVGLLGEKVEI